MSADMILLKLASTVPFIPNTFLHFRSAHKAKQVWKHYKKDI